MNWFKKTLAPVATLLTLLLLFSCNSGKTDGIELKINFGQGDKYLYSTQVSQKINSFNTQMEQTMLMDMVYTYAGTEDTNKKLDITYDRIQMTMNSPMGQSRYDSKDKTKKEPEFAFMDNLIGKSFHIVLAPNGDIVSINGLKELIQSLGATTEPDVQAAVESQLSDTTVRLMMQNSFDMYPGHKVKVGESWGKKSVMKYSGIGVNVENTYTLKSIDGDKATLAITSVMDLPATSMTGAGDAAMQMQMKGKQEGTMEISIATGQILSGKTTQTIEGNISAGGQVLPIAINGDISISSKKL